MDRTLVQGQGRHNNVQKTFITCGEEQERRDMAESGKVRMIENYGFGMVVTGRSRRKAKYYWNTRKKTLQTYSNPGGYGRSSGCILLRTGKICDNDLWGLLNWIKIDGRHPWRGQVY